MLLCRRCCSLFYSSSSGFYFWTRLDSVADAVSSNDALWRSAEVFELRMKDSRQAVQLNKVTSECGTWRSLTRECGDDNFNLRASIDTSGNGFKLLGQTAVIEKKEKAAAFDQDACNAKVRRLQTFLSRYCNACSHVSTLHCDEEVLWEAGRAASENEAEDEVSHFLLHLVLSMKKCVRKHIAHARFL